MRIIYLFLLLFFSCALLAKEEKTVVRVGHFPNITHAQGLIGHYLSRQGKGWFEERLGPNVEVQWFIYQAGPSSMEAIFIDAIDLSYVGPSPTINAYVKSEGQYIRIVCGACSGGSSLVVQPNRIKKIQDFLGKKIATPQLGNTQDVAARFWLKSQGFEVKLTGGDVTVIPMSNASQFVLFQQGQIDGAWTIEPWASRLVLEAKGEVYFDESFLWPETHGKYVTTHLVSGQKFLKSHSDILKKWIAAHMELTEWINTHPELAKQMIQEEFKIETKQQLPSSILDRAWNHIELTNDPIQASLFKNAEQAYQVGFLKEKPNLTGIYDLRFLEEILKQHKSGTIGVRSQ